jgi:hypothetical protein
MNAKNADEKQKARLIIPFIHALKDIEHQNIDLFCDVFVRYDSASRL